MAKGAVYICTVFCHAECRHHVPCEIFNREGHPVLRGHRRHFGYDGELAHEWSGEKGKCTTGPLEDDEEDSGEKMTITMTERKK